MEEFWIVTKQMMGVDYRFPLHYFLYSNIADEKLSSLRQKNENPDVGFGVTHMVLQGDEFIKVKAGEVEYCQNCDNIIKVKGNWRFCADQTAYEASAGKRCGRCKGEPLA